MAKIYESKVDIDRDNLAKEAEERRQSQSLLFGNGIAASALGVALLELGRWRKYERIHFDDNAGGERFTKALGWIGVVVGVASIVGSLFARSKAIEAQTSLSDLGAQNIVLPEDNSQRGDERTIESKGNHLCRLEECRQLSRTSKSKGM